MTNQYEIIEQYLSGQLVGKTLTDFNQRLKTDPKLAEEVALLRKMRQAIKIHNNEKKLKNTFRKLEKGYFKKDVVTLQNQNSQKKMITRIAMAASIALFMVAGLFLWNKQKYSKQSLIAFYKKETTTTDRKEFVKVTKSTIIEKDSQYLYYQYLYATELLTNQEFEKAKMAYNIILENQTKSNYNTKEINFEAVAWNLILIDLAQGKEEKVKEQLNQLVKSSISEKYKKEAQSLQEKINSFWYDVVN